MLGKLAVLRVLVALVERSADLVEVALSVH